MAYMVCLTDQDISKDQRVLSSLSGEDFSSIININESHPSKVKYTDIIYLIFIIILALFNAVLYVKIRCSAKYYFKCGFKRSIALLIKAISAKKHICSCYINTDIQVVYAHDLYPAIAALVAGIPKGAHFIYDSHELQWERNRKNSFLRCMLEVGLEQMVLRKADQLYVVNTRILEQMRQAYQFLPATSIRPNDFYEHYAVPSPLPSSANRPVIVYVGKGTRGRGLELLDISPEQLGFDIYAFLCGVNLPTHIRGTTWHFGPTDYEDTLVSLTRSRRCLMWCYTEKCCLSYELSTPNKFYQALAVGIPIIAREGTYLAEIVEDHRIGCVLKGFSLSDFAPLVCSDMYDVWTKNITVFRRRIKSREIIL